MALSIADSRTHGRRVSLRQLAGICVASLLTVVLLAVPAEGASKGCRVVDKDTGATFSRLQPAVRAAESGAKLIVRGTCHGSTAINKRLIIAGAMSKRGKPILHGDRKSRVLLIRAKGDVVLKNVVVRGGRLWSGYRGAGITNLGDLDLRNVVVRTNASYGIHNDGLLRAWGATRISRNDRGIRNKGRLVVGGSTRLTGNRYVSVVNMGMLVMNGTSAIGRNCWEAQRVTCLGGIYNKGTVVMNEESSISGGVTPGVTNTASGVLTMNDSSSIHGNEIDGGVVTDGVLTMNDSSSIHHNRYDDVESSQSWAGGVTAGGGTVTMNDSSSIHHNSATGGGPVPGGLGVADTALIGVRCAPHVNPNVYDNHPHDCTAFEP